MSYGDWLAGEAHRLDQASREATDEEARKRLQREADEMWLKLDEYDREAAEEAAEHI